MTTMGPYESEVFTRYIFGTIDNLVACLDGLDEDELHWRPSAPQTNSLYAIVMHVCGNAEENILGTLCGRSIQRNRDSEFRATGGSETSLREQWLDLRARLANALAALPAVELDRERRHPRRGVLTGREILLIVARHAAEHWGEAQLTHSLLKTRAKD